jgi:hypothetical protein
MKQLLQLVVLSILVAGCSRDPTVTLSVSEEKGRTVFHLPTRHANGLLGVQVWQPDTGTLLWEMNLAYFRGARLIYGEIPRDFVTFNGGKNSAQQMFPRDDQPPLPFPPDARLLVAIELQYDAFMAASVRTRYFELKTDREGRILSVVARESIKPDAFPGHPEEPNQSLQPTAPSGRG